jgi:hypothetical protein
MIQPLTKIRFHGLVSRANTGVRPYGLLGLIYDNRDFCRGRPLCLPCCDNRFFNLSKGFVCLEISGVKV